MKKILLLLIIPLLMGASCTQNTNSQTTKIQELEEKISNLELEKQQAITSEKISTSTDITVIPPEEKEVIMIKETPIYIPTSILEPEPISEPTPIIIPEDTNNLDNSITKIAKCEAEKELLTTNSKSTIEKYYQDSYFEILKMIDASDDCTDRILPEIITICRNGHNDLAKIEARKVTIEYENNINNTIQKFYIECLK